jgi:hypothetical protein
LHSVPLHHINLKSDFVSGQVIGGVRPTLPFDDISLLFGIDMAGVDLWSWIVPRWDV